MDVDGECLIGFRWYGGGERILSLVDNNSEISLSSVTKDIEDTKAVEAVYCQSFG